MPRICIAKMHQNAPLFVDDNPNTRAVVHTLGFVPLAWTAIDGDNLTVSLQTLPYCITKRPDGKIWICSDKPSIWQGAHEVVWRRGDAAAEYLADVAAEAKEANNAV